MSTSSAAHWRLACCGGQGVHAFAHINQLLHNIKSTVVFTGTVCSTLVFDVSPQAEVKLQVAMLWILNSGLIMAL